jgi:hypothetical protein
MKKIFNLLAIILIVIFSNCKNNNDNERKSAIIKQLDELSTKISNDFAPIREKVSELAKITEKLYENQDKYKCKDKSIYAVSKDGVLYKTRDDGKSAVYVSGFIPINDTIRKIVCFTEPLDSVFIDIMAKFPEVAQVYYNDRFSYNRIYPFIDVLTQYEPKLHIPDFNFYFLADEKHNPSKKAVWVNEPYVDPAGRGWMVSAIAPVYYKDKLMGVPGIDVTINLLTDKYFKNNNEDIIIIDGTGTIVSANEMTINRLNLPPLTNHKYFETIKQNTFKKEDYNLLNNKNKSIRTAFEKIVKNNSINEEFSVDNTNYEVFVSKIQELDWYLIKVAKK